MRDYRKGDRKKQQQLGMPFGTAMARLRKRILFSLLKKCGEDICFRCSRRIDSIEQLSIEHKKVWLDVDPNLFWDIQNIAFSHMGCNIKAARKAKRWKDDKEKWHGQYLYRKNDPGRYRRILAMKRRRYHARYSPAAQSRNLQPESI